MVQEPNVNVLREQDQMVVIVQIALQDVKLVTLLIVYLALVIMDKLILDLLVYQENVNVKLGIIITSLFLMNVYNAQMNVLSVLALQVVKFVQGALVKFLQEQEIFANVLIIITLIQPINKNVQFVLTKVVKHVILFNVILVEEQIILEQLINVPAPMDIFQMLLILKIANNVMMNAKLVQKMLALCVLGLKINQTLGKQVHCAFALKITML